MKFDTKFGLGEIVCTHQRETINGVYPDMILKVVGIQFCLDQQMVYLCRSAGSGNIVACAESELLGDPAFDQWAGKYHEGTV